MFKYLGFLLCLSLVIVAPTSFAEKLSIKSMRLQAADSKARVVFDVSSRPVYNIFALSKPDRLVVDFKNARLPRHLSLPANNDHPLFSGVRTANKGKGVVRVVLDLKATAKEHSFSLAPNHRYGHRLVVDLTPTNPKILTKKTFSSKKSVVRKTVKNSQRDVVVAIDAGHGGKDNGASGPRGTKEKEVVFKIAKKLEAMINKQKGMRAIMVRKGDYFVKLRQRMNIARQAKADLFVSIHADAFKDSRVKGASVFTVSRKGASSEAARWLAKHENSVDQELAGGVNLHGKDKVVRSVILDLSVTATNEVSRNVGGHVLNNFRHLGHLHQDRVQKAGFEVLKSPDIPSILVETAFISNPSEEKKLRSSKHQYRMARAIYKGIYAYFKDNAPPETLLAALAEKRYKAKHVISSGDTLSGIALQYGVSMRAIKSANSLASNTLRVGQILTIPTGS